MYHIKELSVRDYINIFDANIASGIRNLKDKIKRSNLKLSRYEKQEKVLIWG